MMMPGYNMPMNGGAPTGPAAPPSNPGGTMALMRLPKYEIEDRRRMFRRPSIRPQLARLGTLCALAGVALLLVK